MKKTCEKRYSSSWLEVIQSSLGKAEYQDNQKDLCVQKAEQFRHGVEIGGEENFTGSEKWCKEPCVVEYLIGKSNSSIGCIFQNYILSNTLKLGLLHFIFMNFRKTPDQTSLR